MNARPPAWSDLEVFLMVARAGTLAGAAEALGINASTVQRRVGKLEVDLDARLFERSQRGYALTSAGETLYGHVLAMEQEAVVAGRLIGGSDQRLEGTVRVATVDDLAVHILPPILRSFRKEHPRVTLQVDVSPGFADLARQQADVAIRFGQKPSMGDLIVKHVSRVDVSLYGSRGYLHAHGRPTAPEQLQNHWTVRADGPMAGLAMEQVMDRHGDPGRIALRSNSMLARLSGIQGGLGLGFLPCFLGERDPDLEPLAFDFPEAASNLWMVIHADLRRNARVRAFVDFAHGALVDLRGTFEHPPDRPGHSQGG